MQVVLLLVQMAGAAAAAVGPQVLPHLLWVQGH